uniref:Uncharacterized protein n=1 Tax=Ditylenchus dipsaci TaxID=166011 RepID=A0A915E4H3_9BILA
MVETQVKERRLRKGYYNYWPPGCCCSSSSAASEAPSTSAPDVLTTDRSPSASKKVLKPEHSELAGLCRCGVQSFVQVFNLSAVSFS